MDTNARTCELCGNPIEPGQAWMQAADGSGVAAHSGCVYSNGEAARDRWMPSEISDLGSSQVG